MKIQLTVYSLILALEYIAYLLMITSQNNRGGRRPNRAGSNEIAERMLAACRESLPVYIMFAAVALLMIDFGKPDRLPQYAGWAIVVLQVLRDFGSLKQMKRFSLWIGVVIYLGLVYLWGYQLPIFDTLPY